MSRQIDNANLPAKLELRRRMLAARFPAGSEISVLDCCAGEKGEIWRALRREKLGLKIRYMGLDRKAVGRGVVQFDSQRWLREVAWQADVVDVDTYGEPWAHYRAAVDRGLPRLVVFLTYGFRSTGMAQIGGAACELAGIPGKWARYLPKNTPGGICDWTRPPGNVRDILVRSALGYPWRAGYRIAAALQVVSGLQGTTFYWGVALDRGVKPYSTPTYSPPGSAGKRVRPVVWP